MNCDEICEKTKEPCQQKECKYWLDYLQDMNCTLVCARQNGALTLREIATRLGVSFVRVKQIEEAALKKIKKKNSESLQNEYYL